MAAAAPIHMFVAGQSMHASTIHKLRAPGMGWFRLRLFVWSHYATSIILVLATPVLALSLALNIAERVLFENSVL